MKEIFSSFGAIYWSLYSQGLQVLLSDNIQTPDLILAQKMYGWIIGLAIVEKNFKKIGK